MSSFERRKHERAAVTLTVEVRDTSGFAIHSTRDVSSGGVFLDRAIPYPLGSTIDLAFTLPGDSRSIRCRGMVVNVPDTHDYGVAVRFLDLAPNDEVKLSDFTTRFNEGRLAR